MFSVVVPILSVILIGYLFGKYRRVSLEAELVINSYVLYFGLPCMIFLSVAQASVEQLRHGSFFGAGLVGIVCAYGLGLLLARFRGIRTPQSALTGMAASFGNTGYMGIPLVVAALGDKAAAPAALATILHNIPVIMAVVMTFGAHSRQGGIFGSLFRALRTVLSNPLTLSALAGIIFAALALPLPLCIVTLTKFLGAAAPPTALFALGLSLSRVRVREHASRENLRLILPLIGIKIVVQPAVTLLAALFWFGMAPGETWFITAVVMAAQPIGAVVYLFAVNYKQDPSVPSLAIVFSSLVSVLTLPLLLGLLLP